MGEEGTVEYNDTVGIMRRVGRGGEENGGGGKGKDEGEWGVRGVRKGGGEGSMVWRDRWGEVPC